MREPVMCLSCTRGGGGEAGLLPRRVLAPSGAMKTKEAPTTSERLLRDIAADRQSLRWADFANRYRPMMRAYLARGFPTLAGEADDLVQETLLVLVEKLPDYRYDPGELGSFHNYLTGILRNRALRALARRARSRAADGDYAFSIPSATPATADASGPDPGEWRDAVCDIALRQVLADPALQERTREVFRRCAVAGESPAAVAEAFGMERNAVDQIKNRLLGRMRKIVAALASAEP